MNKISLPEQVYIVFFLFFLQLLLSYSASFTESSIVLDDISFENCGEEDIPEASDRLSCDFEKDTCSWYHDYTGSLLWERTRGMFGEISGNGEDHFECSQEYTKRGEQLKLYCICVTQGQIRHAASFLSGLQECIYGGPELT